MGIFRCISVQTILRFTLCLLLSSFFSQAANATDYYWAGSSGRNYGSSGDSACRAVAAVQTSRQIKKVEFKLEDSGNTLRCTITTPSENNPNVESSFDVTLTKRGDSCPADSEWSASTASCVPKPKDCSTTTEQTLLAKGPIGSVVTSGGRSYVVDSGAPTVCSVQCQYAPTTSRSTTCYKVPVSSSQGVCN